VLMCDAERSGRDAFSVMLNISALERGG
jgi:hypothetical protein